LIETSVALMKVLAASLEHLGANPEEDNLALGGKVVIDAAQADVRGMRHLPHREPLGPALFEEWGDRQIDLAPPKEGILAGTAGFSEHRGPFL
jgi:hypothetical protein